MGEIEESFKNLGENRFKAENKLQFEAKTCKEKLKARAEAEPKAEAQTKSSSSKVSVSVS